MYMSVYICICMFMLVSTCITRFKTVQINSFITSTPANWVIRGPHKFATALRESKSYAVEALRLGGKQMLCDIIKWTIIIIIAAIVFLIVHHILCGEDPAIAASRSR